MAPLALAALVLWGLAFLLTGNAWGIFYPVAFGGHLHPFLWGACAVGAVIAALIARPLRHRVPPKLRPAAIVLLLALGSVAGLAIAADTHRSVMIARFAPDQADVQSLLRSLRTAPREHQLVLHAAMLKQCTAYGWSYRSLEPYEIPERAIANVLPPEWFAPGTRCGPVSN